MAEAPYRVEGINQNNQKALKQLTEFKEESQRHRDEEEKMQFGLNLFSIPSVGFKDLDKVETELELL